MSGSGDLLKKMLGAGEEQFGKIASALLRNDQFVAVLQKTVTRALDAKGTLDRQVASALGSMHVPSRHDVQKLHERLGELERIFEDLAMKVDAIATKLNEKG